MNRIHAKNPSDRHCDVTMTSYSWWRHHPGSGIPKKSRNCYNFSENDRQKMIDPSLFVFFDTLSEKNHWKGQKCQKSGKKSQFLDFRFFGKPGSDPRSCLDFPKSTTEWPKKRKKCVKQNFIHKKVWAGLRPTLILRNLRKPGGGVNFSPPPPVWIGLIAT